MSASLIRYWGSYFKTPRQAREFARVFANAASRGWRTHLVCCRPPDDPGWLAPLYAVGTRIEYLPRPRRNFDAGVVWRAFKLCRRLGCDVFHCDNMHTSPLIGAALAGVPVRLWSKRSMQPAFEEGRRPTLRDRLVLSVRASCLVATRVLAVSGAVRDELVGLGVPAAKFVVLPNPVPEMSAVQREPARAQLGYGDGEFVIATVGHAVPVKGWDILLRAFGRIAADLPNARLLFVGSTGAPHERACFEQLQQSIRHAGLAERVRFAGHVPDVFVPLAAADAFAMPSRSEGYCNALMEAMHAGLPCVSAKVGAATDFIRSGENGLLVEREDERGLADALRLLGRDPALRRRLAQAAKATPVAWDLEEYAQGLVDLYAALLGPTRDSASATKACRCSDSKPASRRTTARIS